MPHSKSVSFIKLRTALLNLTLALTILSGLGFGSVFYVYAVSGCGTPISITGGGSYNLVSGDNCFKYVNATFTRGGMFSVMNGADVTVSNVVQWYGGRNETVTSCINDSQTLNGNGAQLNNFTVAKDSGSAMYVSITANKANTVSLNIQNWQNGAGCSATPTPISSGPTNTPPPTNTPTNTLVVTNTPTNTQPPTNTPTNTLVVTATATPSQTPTNTLPPSNTPTNTLVVTNTPTNTQPPTNTPTNTLPPSNTPTNTPIPPTNTPGSSALKVQYKNGENPVQPSNNQVKPHLQILNTGATSVALNTLKARYWFTRDTAQPQTFYCDYAVLGCATITQAMVQMGTPVTGADFYLEVGFSSGTLNAGGSTSEIQNRFNKNDWSNYSETDDWSYGSNVTYADAPHVTLYQNGTLVWGAEPCSSSCPTATPPPPTNTPTKTNTPGPTPTSGPTSTPGPGNLGNATWFSALGQPYGGCGITQSALDSQNFLALNVQNTPGDYSTFYPRPISSQFADKIGLFNNGLNCGRWVHVVIKENCNGINDGAPSQPFCRGGTGWFSDAYNDAALDMIVADSCQDSNAWCRDDPYHVDLAQASLNLFVKNGQPVGDMYPNHWNNRHVNWQFIEAPNYTGDIRIGFIQGAQIGWPAIAITHLKNGIHGVDYFANGAWTKAAMDADLGQDYIIGPTASGGSQYQIRVYDVADQLINAGRIYNFSFPATCGSQCTSAFNEVTYTVQ